MEVGLGGTGAASPGIPPLLSPNIDKTPELSIRDHRSLKSEKGTEGGGGGSAVGMMGAATTGGGMLRSGRPASGGGATWPWVL